MGVFVCSSRVVPCTSWVGVRYGGVCFGLGCCRAPPLLAGVLGRVCVCGGTTLVPRHSWVGVRGVGVRAWLGFWLCSAPLGWVVGVCVYSCGCPACTPSFLGGRLWRWGCAGVVVGGVCPPRPLWCLSFFFRGGGRRRVSCRGFVVSFAGCPGPGSRGVRPPFPSLSGCGFVRFLIFFCTIVVCVGVFGVSLPLVGRCSRFGVAGFWLGGPPVPLRGVPSSVPPGLGVWPPFMAWMGSFVAVGLSRAPPNCFLSGGGLPVPPSAFPGLLHALVRIRCGLPVCCWCLGFARSCPGPVGRVGYVQVGLGGPSCWVRFWLCRLGGCARRLHEALG